jgi:hypothetical protein
MPEIPADNALTVSRVALGKQLFYDPILSRDSSLSCASCHLAEAGFADHHPVSIGIEGRVGFRNSPTLTNVAYHPWFFKEGGSPSLELQAVGPIENHVEMDIDIALLGRRLPYLSEYHPLAQQAYGRDLDIYVLIRPWRVFSVPSSAVPPPMMPIGKGIPAPLMPRSSEVWPSFSPTVRGAASVTEVLTSRTTACKIMGPTLIMGPTWAAFGLPSTVLT